MNFFEHQELARRQTRRMLWLFAFAVAAIVVVIDIAVLLAIGFDARRVSWNGLLFISAMVVLVIQLGSLYRVATLRAGGKAVALGLGAVPVPPSSDNFAYRRLRNVVEEIAIASGVPVPEIFVLEGEDGINAFAAGYAPTDAAITVTRGALDKLTRSELQGVIGHEFSHVLNGDMRLNIRLMGAVFGLVVIATIGRKIAHGGRGGGSAVLIGFALFAAGYLGVVLARMIKASISRQREFLADASAVQFTRQTEGIAGALKKIGGLAEGSRLATKDSEEVAHMLFGDGVGYSALFATHPPLAARIRRLDPSFREDELKAVAADWSRPIQMGEADLERADVSIAGFAPASAAASLPRERGVALPDPRSEVELVPRAVARQVGNPGSDDRAIAHTLRATIPEPLREAARQPERAVPLVLALLLNVEADVRERQLALIALGYDAGTRELVRVFGAALAELHPMQRLPLAALAFPTLRRRPRPHVDTFVATLRQLIDADRRVTLHEYCLARLIDVQVVAALNPAAKPTIGRIKLGDAATELRDLLAILAAHGHDDEAAARRAYAAGMHEVLPNAPIAYAPPAQWAAALDRALPRLDRLDPAGKELVVRALTRAIAVDGKVSVVEAELLRTVCAALRCPLPPLLQSTG
ncbi:M48 family metallopeptidase [Dokdonella sp.]|uniref:M48 family metallopeptidase n=1 Tax=Dokdonella sp. TaxID=2291710 RepID=UPI001B122A7C|nr:M48 family metallopeptidase [Dokdonella sp.]MBO9664887.1 M48 family metallopeptidase [Dokdonella sp.]